MGNTRSQLVNNSSTYFDQAQKAISDSLITVGYCPILVIVDCAVFIDNFNFMHEQTNSERMSVLNSFLERLKSNHYIVADVSKTWGHPNTSTVYHVYPPQSQKLTTNPISA